ncbi:MAG: stage 0 sporulation family protein [Desulfuromonadaceae bacterium]
MQNEKSEKNSKTQPAESATGDNNPPDNPQPPEKENRRTGKEAIVVTVKFRNAGKQYDFDTNDIELKCQDQVVVETSRGRALGTVVRTPRSIVDIGKRPQELKKVLRLATEADINMTRISRAKEDEAFAFCVERIKKRNLPMNLVKADYLFDGSKILFHFTAENRIDFRELVKDLAHHFHTRIEMRQIGVRDEAKLIGGLGICGRELCCSTFITEFQPVSVKMAKQQGLALNPSKISGQCGRLLCCLGYEYETYCSMAKKLPKTGRKVQYEGQEATVVAVNILAQSVTLRLEGKNVEVPIDAFNRGKEDASQGTSKSGKQDRNQSSQSSERKGREGRKPTGTNRVTARTKASQAEPRPDEKVTGKEGEKTTPSRPEGKKNRSGSRRNRQKQRSPSKQGSSHAQEGQSSPPSPAETKGDMHPVQDKGEKSPEQNNQKKRPPRRRNKRRPKPKPKT